MTDLEINAIEHTRPEEELRRYAEALQNADRRKDEFLAMLAHELRDPLAPIRNAVGILRAIGPVDPRVTKASDMIERQVGHLTRLVDDLLDISRVAQGKITLDQAPVDLVQVVHLGVELARPLIDARAHQLTLVLPPPEALWVEGDATRLAQVVSNLLINAAKYTDHGGRIELRLARAAQEAWLTVTDTGIGIAPELLPQVFEPFTQAARSRDRAQGGLGIGLSVVRRLVTLHRGSVEAASAGIGCGSTFTVRLPLIHASRSAVRTAARTKSTAHKRVLLVDDNVDAAESLALLLDLEGHTVCTAHEGSVALAKAMELRPEVCLLDIRLPDMDGYALARRLRALPEAADAAYFALSGYAKPDDSAWLSEAGFDRYLVKPVDCATILALIAGEP
jgi:CheY-like chemotaxis protein